MNSSASRSIGVRRWGWHARFALNEQFCARAPERVGFCDYLRNHVIGEGCSLILLNMSPFCSPIGDTLFSSSHTCNCRPVRGSVIQTSKQDRHHFICNFCVKGSMCNDHTVDGRAIDEVEHELPVKILADLSPFNSAIKNDSNGFAPGLEEPLAKESREFLIGLTFRNKLTQDMPSGAPVENHH